MLLCTLPTQLTGMENLKHRFTPEHATATMSESLNYASKPIHFYKKTWQQRIMTCASLLVQCFNNCYGYDDNDDYDREPEKLKTTIPNIVPEQNTKPETLSIRISTAIEPTTPATDPESIERHYGASKTRLEQVLSNAPTEAHDIIELLRTPSLYDEEVRITVLFGDPGVGKSTLARAIAYKAGWFVELMYGRQIRATHRGGTSINLQHKLDEVLSKKRKTVVVIDEINRLFEHYNSSKYDTGDTAEDFWTFLDEHQKNTNLYIIGTTNRIDKFPPQLQSRLRGSFIESTSPNTEIAMRNIFLQLFNTHTHELGKSCNTQFVLSFLRDEYIKQWNARDFAVLRSLAIRLARRANNINPRTIIEAPHLSAALTLIKNTSQKMKYGTEQESEEKVMHKENLRHQRALHDENIKMQKEHFVQGLVIQKKMQSNQKSEGGSLGFSVGTSGLNINGSVSEGVNNISKDDNCITNNLSDEQIKLYREQQQIKDQRNNGKEQVKKLLKKLSIKISELAIQKKQLDTIQFSSTQSLIEAIDKVTQQSKRLSDSFSHIQIPSQEEINNYTQSINTLNQAIDILLPKVKSYLSSVQKNISTN